ncbi:MAG: hypothetical protein ACLVBB_02560 [Dysosmobacter welbionis]
MGGGNRLAGNRSARRGRLSLASDAERLSAGASPMYCQGGTLLGLISVADPVKETSAAAIQKMRGRGIGPCC